MASSKNSQLVSVDTSEYLQVVYGADIAKGGGLQQVVP